MIIYSRDCPSEGRDKGSSEYEIHPLDFEGIYNYINNEELTKLRKYVKDLKLLIKMDERIENASLLDADYLIYLMKCLTISEELTFNYSYHCQCGCGKYVQGVVSSKSIIFRSIDEKYLTLDSVVIGGKELKFSTVTIGEFLDFVSKLPRQLENTDLKLIKLASFFSKYITFNAGYLIDLFKHATHDDIKLVTLLKTVYFECIQPITMKCEKGGETVVTLDDVTTDLFRLILQNGRLDQSKIRFK